MIKLLNSNYPPLQTKNHSFPEIFFSLLGSAEHIRIASGYISEDAIADLLGIYEKGYNKELNLIAGMGLFDGFSVAQYNALLKFGKLLLEKQCGNVFVANRSKYHGKVYSFRGIDNILSAIIGSSNLTKINTPDKIYDTDVLINGEAVNDEIETFLSNLQDKYCVPIQQVDQSAIKILEPDNLFLGYLDVTQLTDAELADVRKKLTKVSFDIQVKPEKKSHLNCYFGKPRMVNGLERPRDWYEANIIVSTEVTSDGNYPRKNQLFTVVTDDGYRFKCKANGDYAKNFRSAKDLKIMGRWLKGRMEKSGVLQIGEFVTESTQKQYGRTGFTMTKTSIPDTWYLDYGVE
ncbi:MAG: NgoFVII family restriction endonuclease [Planctomycetaceae bacterium]|jgi:hypothetical protein|nr:NgoFVII family restriction endonuclease [Planctomycetaceae bacterium]